MPISFTNYQPGTPAQTSPFADLLKNAMAAYQTGIQSRYAQPMAEQGLVKAVQENQWNPKIWQSEIGLRGAQAGLAGSEASKNRFLVQNPEYISAEGKLMALAIEQQRKQQEQQQAQLLSQQQQPQQPQVQPQSNILNQPNQASNGQQTPFINPKLVQSQFSQPQNNQAAQAQYSPDALAFNPPTLQSPTGNPSLDNLYYNKFGMSPIVKTQIELAKAQSEKYQTQNIERNKEFNNQAVFANESTLNAQKFLDALDRSTSLERGYASGKTPAITNSQQEMDAYGNNMAIAATKLMQGENAVHAADIEINKMAKPGRQQNEEVAFDLAHAVIAKNDRLKERQQFYSEGTQLNGVGLKPEIMDAMWNKYETDRPYIDVDTKMPNDAYKGTWKDYLSPQAINSFLQGKDYTPPNQKSLENANFSKKDLETIKTWAKKHNEDPKDFSKKNLYKLAKSEGKTLSQFKEELHKLGVL